MLDEMLALNSAITWKFCCITLHTVPDEGKYLIVFTPYNTSFIHVTRGSSPCGRGVVKNPILPCGLAFKWVLLFFSTIFPETAVSCCPIAIYKRLSCHLSYLSHVAQFHCLCET